MLYKLDKEDNSVELMPYCDFESLGKKEKDLENLLADNLSELYIEDGQLMTIFQERARQEEPDLCALDRNGNLVIFELKRSEVKGDTTIQVMRYAQTWGQKTYYDLDTAYKKYCKKNKEKITDLADAHKEAFALSERLDESLFNRFQKMIIVGSSSDRELISAIDYWKSRKLDIDFIPYRIYEIGKKYFLEFFSKPYDVHINPKDRKGIIFDTNYTYDSEAIWDMMKNHKISAYGAIAGLVNSFNNGDYVFYYHKGYGIVGAGIIKSSEAKENKAYTRDYELYRDVELLTHELSETDDLRKVSISPSELCEMLDKGFYWARTTKVPYLSESESKIIIEALKRKYMKYDVQNN